jgi:Mrp family chromosome partitioning ATPase/uncharacterized protein involved in exopolysaccharide biosynthesis
MSHELQMVPAQQDTFVPENVDVGAGEGGGGANPLAKIHQYLRGRYLKAIMTGTLLAAAIAPAAYFLVPLKYSSVGQIQVRSTILSPLSGGTGDSNLISNYEGFVQTTVEQLRRHDVILRAVRTTTWRAVAPAGTMPEAEEVAAFADSLDISHPGGTELIFVRFRDANPRRAAAGVDALISTYKELSETLSPDNYTERMDVLNRERNRLQNEIQMLKTQIENVAPEYHGDDFAQVHGQTLARLQELAGMIASRKFALTMMTSHPTTEPANDSATTRPMAATITPELAAQYDPELGRLAAEAERTRVEIDKLTRRGLGPSNPAIRDLTLSLASIEDARNQRFEKLQERLKNAPETPLARTNDGSPLPSPERMQASIDELEKEQARLTEVSSEQVRKLREIDEKRAKLADNQNRLADFDAQLFKSELNRPFSTVDRRIIPSEASVPLHPDKDRRIVAAAGGGFGGMALGFGIFALIGFFDRRLRTVADARDSLDRSNRILGILPYLPEDLADPDQSSTAAFCVHHIRTLLQVGGSGTGNTVMAVTSAAPGDGKTSLVISLGLSYAATGAKTLLIDCDLIGAGLTSRANAIARRKIGSILLREKRISQEQLDQALDQAHRSGKRLGEVLVDMGHLQQGELQKALSMQQESSLGLLDVLDGEPLADCVFPGWANNLSILPVGNVGATHAGQLSLRSVRKIIADARTQYDVVLVDTGPILGSLEACLITSAVDEVIVTVARDQQRPLVEKTFSRLREVGARVAGIVFNRAPREDVETGGYMSSLTSQRLQSPVIQGTTGDSKADRLQRLGPVVRAVAGGTGNTGGDGV